MATTTKAYRDEMDRNVLQGMTTGRRLHGMVKYIRYEANRVARGETDSYPDGPYTEAQVRGSLKRLQKQGLVEDGGWRGNRARWTYITDEMRAERAAAKAERERNEALAEAVQVALGFDAYERDEDGDVDDYHAPVKHDGGGRLKLQAKAVKALAEKLGITL